MKANFIFHDEIVPILKKVINKRGIFEYYDLQNLFIILPRFIIQELKRFTLKKMIN